MAKTVKIGQRLGYELQDLNRQLRNRPRDGRSDGEQPTQLVGGKSKIMLLEDLNSGSFAWASFLSGDLLTRKYLLTIFGLIDDDAEFDLEWSGETVEGIRADSTPAEVKARLEEFSFVDDNEFGVQFGRHTRELREGFEQEFSVYRWIIKQHDPEGDDYGLFVPTVPEYDQTWAGAEETFLQDSYEITRVVSYIPVGVDIENNSPMRAGAIGSAFYDEELGWCVDAIEARNITGDFVEPPSSGSSSSSSTTTTGSGGTTTTTTTQEGGSTTTTTTTTPGA